MGKTYPGKVEQYEKLVRDSGIDLYRKVGQWERLTPGKWNSVRNLSGTVGQWDRLVQESGTVDESRFGQESGTVG